MATKKIGKKEANVKKMPSAAAKPDKKQAKAAEKTAVKAPLKTKAADKKTAAKRPAASSSMPEKKPAALKAKENAAKKPAPAKSAAAKETKSAKTSKTAVTKDTKKPSEAAVKEVKKPAAASAKETKIPKAPALKEIRAAKPERAPAKKSAKAFEKPAEKKIEKAPLKAKTAEPKKETKPAGGFKESKIVKPAVKPAEDKKIEVKEIKSKPAQLKPAGKTEAKERTGVKKTISTKGKTSGEAKNKKPVLKSKPAVKAEAKHEKTAGLKAKKTAQIAAKKAASEKASAKPAAREVKKVVVKTPLSKPEVMNVTSADVENLYGKHYIINTAQELPETYGKNRLITLVRDPEWIYTFWDVATETIAGIKKSMGSKEFDESKRIIRVYDGETGHSYSDIELTDTASSWYIHVKPDAAYVLELGYRSKRGEFYKVASSNDVAMPPAGVSAENDEKWMVKDGVFEKIYELSGGAQLGMSSADIMQAIARGMKPEEFSQLITRGVSSETLSSQFAAEKAREVEVTKKQRKFWMVLNTELIVYGATEPDASVTLMGKPVRLRPDGTFSIRMALPDTDIDIPAVGVSADKVDEITITPEVHKRTHYSKKEKELSL